MTVMGVEGEERHDFTKAESRHIRTRSLRLLGSLLRPAELSDARKQNRQGKLDAAKLKEIEDRSMP